MNNIHYYKTLFLFLLIGCAPDYYDKLLKEEYERLSQEEKDYIERFNVTAKDISGFPPEGKSIEKYFHVFKSVPRLEDAKIFIFGERHTHAANQLWTAGVINRLVKKNDKVLFEGANARTPIAGSVAEQIVTSIFAAREYEKLKSHKIYKATALSKLKSKYLHLFLKTKKFLALDILHLGVANGFYWDLREGSPGLVKRNESMVLTIQFYLKGDNRVFVITGAAHTPPFEFAWQMDFFQKNHPNAYRNFLAQIGAKEDEVNDVFFDHFKRLNPSTFGTTKNIFDYLKDKDFAIMIPKNLPGIEDLKFPKSPNLQ